MQGSDPETGEATCPRCGASSRGNRWCVECGLNLQPGAAKSSEADDDLTSAKRESAETPGVAPAAQSRTGVSRGLVLGVASAIVVAGVGLAILLTSSSDNGTPDEPVVTVSPTHASEVVGSQPISYWQKSFAGNMNEQFSDDGEDFRISGIACEKEDDLHLLCRATYTDGEEVVHRVAVDDPQPGSWTSVALDQSAG